SPEKIKVYSPLDASQDHRLFLRFLHRVNGIDCAGTDSTDGRSLAAVEARSSATSGPPYPTAGRPSQGRRRAAETMPIVRLTRRRTVWRNTGRAEVSVSGLLTARGAG